MFSDRTSFCPIRLLPEASAFLVRFHPVVDLPAFKLKANKLAIAAQRGARLVVRQAVSIGLFPVPYYSRWGMYPQAILVVIALIWFEYRPAWAIQGPSVAMSLLGLAAIYMAVRSPDTRIERAVWIGISVGLFFVEMHSIAIEQKRHDTEQDGLRRREENSRQEQTKAFSQLITRGDNLYAALTEEKTLATRNLNLTARNLENITGGDEYCWVVPTTPLPVDLGGDPAYQGNNWWQLALKNSGKVVLPTCDLQFMPFPTNEEIKKGLATFPQPVFYHFEKVPIMGRRYSRYVPYFIKGDRLWSGVIRTPTHSFNEVIKFEPDPKDRTRYIPTCTVAAPSGKVLEKDCNPQ